MKRKRSKSVKNSGEMEKLVKCWSEDEKVVCNICKLNTNTIINLYNHFIKDHSKLELALYILELLKLLVPKNCQIDGNTSTKDVTKDDVNRILSKKPPSNKKHEDLKVGKRVKLNEIFGSQDKVCWPLMTSKLSNIDVDILDNKVNNTKLLEKKSLARTDEDKSAMIDDTIEYVIQFFNHQEDFHSTNDSFHSSNCSEHLAPCSSSLDGKKEPKTPQKTYLYNKGFKNKDGGLTLDENPFACDEEKNKTELIKKINDKKEKVTNSLACENISEELNRRSVDRDTSCMLVPCRRSQREKTKRNEINVIEADHYSSTQLKLNRKKNGRGAKEKAMFQIKSKSQKKRVIVKKESKMNFESLSISREGSLKYESLNKTCDLNSNLKFETKGKSLKSEVINENENVSMNREFVVFNSEKSTDEPAFLETSQQLSVHEKSEIKLDKKMNVKSIEIEKTSNDKIKSGGERPRKLTSVENVLSLETKSNCVEGKLKMQLEEEQNMFFSELGLMKFRWSESDQSLFSLELNSSNSTNEKKNLYSLEHRFNYRIPIKFFANEEILEDVFLPESSHFSSFQDSSSKLSLHKPMFCEEDVDQTLMEEKERQRNLMKKVDRSWSDSVMEENVFKKRHSLSDLPNCLLSEMDDNFSPRPVYQAGNEVNNSNVPIFSSSCHNIVAVGGEEYVKIKEGKDGVGVGVQMATGLNLEKNCQMIVDEGKFGEESVSFEKDEKLERDAKSEPSSCIIFSNKSSENSLETFSNKSSENSLETFSNKSSENSLETFSSVCIKNDKFEKNSNWKVNCVCTCIDDAHAHAHAHACKGLCCEKSLQMQLALALALGSCNETNQTNETMSVTTADICLSQTRFDMRGHGPERGRHLTNFSIDSILGIAKSQSKDLPSYNSTKKQQSSYSHVSHVDDAHDLNQVDSKLTFFHPKKIAPLKPIPIYYPHPHPCQEDTKTNCAPTLTKIRNENSSLGMRISTNNSSIKNEVCFQTQMNFFNDNVEDNLNNCSVGTCVEARKEAFWKIDEPKSSENEKNIGKKEKKFSMNNEKKKSKRRKKQKINNNKTLKDKDGDIYIKSFNCRSSSLLDKSLVEKIQSNLNEEEEQVEKVEKDDLITQLWSESEVKKNNKSVIKKELKVENNLDCLGLGGLDAQDREINYCMKRSRRSSSIVSVDVEVPVEFFPLNVCNEPCEPIQPIQPIELMESQHSTHFNGNHFNASIKQTQVPKTYQHSGKSKIKDEAQDNSCIVKNEIKSKQELKEEKASGKSKNDPRKKLSKMAYDEIVELESVKLDENTVFLFRENKDTCSKALEINWCRNKSFKMESRKKKKRNGFVNINDINSFSILSVNSKENISVIDGNKVKTNDVSNDVKRNCLSSSSVSNTRECVFGTSLLKNKADWEDVKFECTMKDLHLSCLMDPNSPRFFCSFCEKNYSKKNHLIRHVRMHINERPFKCYVCLKGFTTNSILKQHMRLHSGERPYICSVCGKCFSQKSSLLTHSMLHSGKPFKCFFCKDAFVSNHKLMRHLRRHDLEDSSFNCLACSSQFSSDEGFIQHLSTNHNYPPPNKGISFCKNSSGRTVIKDEFFSKKRRKVRHCYEPLANLSKLDQSIPN